MTTLGKALAFLNLVIGIGLAMWSVSLYTNRPNWFVKDIPDVVDKGNTVHSFASLTAEINALGKSATALSGKWGSELDQIEKSEKTRKMRQGKLATRLKLAREGDESKKGAPGFYDLVEDPVTKLIDVDKTGAVVLGPPPPGETIGQPLRGADKLLGLYNSDAIEISRIAQASQKLRLEEREIAAQVLSTEARYLKQAEIRENLTNEFFYLSSFEVNVYEDRETVQRRKGQLQRRLASFGLGGN